MDTPFSSELLAAMASAAAGQVMRHELDMGLPLTDDSHGRGSIDDSTSQICQILNQTDLRYVSVAALTAHEHVWHAGLHQFATDFAQSRDKTHVGELTEEEQETFNREFNNKKTEMELQGIVTMWLRVHLHNHEVIFDDGTTRLWNAGQHENGTLDPGLKTEIANAFTSQGLDDPTDGT